MNQQDSGRDEPEPMFPWAGISNHKYREKSEKYQTIARRSDHNAGRTLDAYSVMVTHKTEVRGAETQEIQDQISARGQLMNDPLIEERVVFQVSFINTIPHTEQCSTKNEETIKRIG